ncbi:MULTISPECIES: hypothetical protein [Pseudomonas]|uniref:hypothetical protein n=1 Tax=Pseudomonas TaxID=286 RepID=UPI000C887B0C|nr:MULTISPECIES: hypothetical protein [Pseudomonas]PNB24319.1 hypothetical protein C1X69_01545 [Pseudomonas sp. FW305-67]
MATVDLTSKIERIEAFEERVGVRFQGMSAFLEADDDYISLQVHGEIHASNGAELKDDVTVVIAVYDQSDRVVGTDTRYYYSESFFGFEAFSESLSLSVKNISKIRVYPKKG